MKTETLLKLKPKITLPKTDLVGLKNQNKLPKNQQSSRNPQVGEFLYYPLRWEKKLKGEF